MENINDRLLSLEEMQQIASFVINSFDEEILRTAQYSTVKVSTYFYSQYISKDIFSFFVLSNLKTLTEDIFSNEVYRDFILNLTDKVSFLLTNRNFSVNEQLIPTLVESICRTKITPNSEYSLIMKPINESLYIERDTLTKLFQDNFWLIVLYLLMMFFTHSETYKQFLSK